MGIPNLKELDRLIALCRKRGVKTVKIDNIELTLGEPVFKPSKTKKSTTSSTFNPELIQTDNLSSDELLFWSSNPTLEESTN